MSDKIWCAMCGKHGDHGSGTCHQLAGSKKVDEFTDARITKSVRENGIPDGRFTEATGNSKSHDLTFLKEIKDKLEAGIAGDPTQTEFAMQMINDWIDELSL